MRILKSFSLAAALLCLAAGPVSADRAVVVGVNRYENLPASAQLRGCEADAAAVASQLRGLGFEVDLVTGKRATRAGILQALNQARAANAPDERFVLFFAGHGSKVYEKGVVLLPADTFQDCRNTLSGDEVHRAVEAVPASGRTILLDSCFSGALTRSLTGFQSRFFPLGGSGTRAVNQQSGAEALGQASKKVFYLTAARSNEEALECAIGGQHRGVFSYYLEKELVEKPSQWGGLLSRVGAQVVSATRDRQHTTHSQGYEQVNLFGPQGSAASTAPQPGPAAGEKLTLWEQFNTDRVDARRLALTMEPDRTPLKLGEKMRFQVRVGDEGYLVLIERGTSGNVNLLFPRSAELVEARVVSGSQVTIPDGGMTYSAREPGTERLKAILFRSASDAQKLLATFRSTRSLPLEAFSRDLGLDPAEPAAAFITSDITFEAVP